MPEAVTETAQNPTDASTSSTESAAGSTTVDTTNADTTTQQDATTSTQPAEGGNTAEENTSETETKPEGAPEKYDFKAPEGTEYDSTVLDTFSKAAKDANLTQDVAQKVLETMAPALAERANQQVEALGVQWLEATKADKELGGDKLQENLSIAKKALDAYGTPELRTLLDNSRLGNNPEMLRAFYRIGKAMSEDGFVAGQRPVDETSRANRLYDKTK